jgi:hypothetical protein
LGKVKHVEPHRVNSPGDELYLYYSAQFRWNLAMVAWDFLPVEEGERLLTIFGCTVHSICNFLANSDQAYRFRAPSRRNGHKQWRAKWLGRCPCWFCEAFRSTLARDEGFVVFIVVAGRRVSDISLSVRAITRVGTPRLLPSGCDRTTGFNRRHQHFAPCGRIS